MKGAAAELAARRSLKRQRAQLDNLGAIQAEVAALEAQRAKRAQRRAAVKAERAATQPPRLGKLKFTPQPVQARLTRPPCCALSFPVLSSSACGAWACR